MNYDPFHTVVARQAKKIYELKDALKTHIRQLRDIDSMLVCIGGPLNDNKLKFNNEQLILLDKIHKLCEL